MKHVNQLFSLLCLFLFFLVGCASDVITPTPQPDIDPMPFNANAFFTDGCTQDGDVCVPNGWEPVYLHHTTLPDVTLDGTLNIHTADVHRAILCFKQTDTFLDTRDGHPVTNVIQAQVEIADWVMDDGYNYDDHAPGIYLTLILADMTRSWSSEVVHFPIVGQQTYTWVIDVEDDVEMVYEVCFQHYGRNQSGQIQISELGAYRAHYEYLSEFRLTPFGGA